MQLLPAQLIKIHDETPSVKRFSFKVLESGFTFKPGQWIDFYARLNGIQTVAGFSLTSSPLQDNEEFELAVKLSPHPVTAYLHEEAKVGELFEISNGMGPVFYDREISEQIVLIAGGIGVTPLISMFRTIRDNWKEVEVHLLYSDNDADEFAYQEEIRQSCAQDSRLHAYFTFTGPPHQKPEWVQHQGRMDAQWLKSLGIPVMAHYFLCGPQNMLGKMRSELQSLGVLRECIHYEEW